MSERPGLAIDLVPDGITAGVVAGALIMVAHMLAAFVLGGSLEGPLRLVSSLVLGPAALSRIYPFLSAAVIGSVIHFELSALYGVFFVVLLGRLRRLDIRAPRLLVTGAAFGAILWVTNYQILAAVFFPSFAVVSPFWLGLVEHSLFFGMTLGLYVALVRPGRVGREDEQTVAP